MKALIATDEPSLARILVSRMKEAGCDVQVASTTQQLLGWVDKQRLLFLDWALEGDNTSSLIERIRISGDCPYVHILVVMAPDRRVEYFTLLEAGADGVIWNPLDPNEVSAVLNSALRQIDLRDPKTPPQLTIQDLREKLNQHSLQLAETVSILESTNRRFSELFAGLPIACFTFDRDGKIREWNRASEALYGYRGNEAIEKTIFETIVQPENDIVARERVERVFIGESFEGIEEIDRRSDGAQIIVLSSTFPLIGNDGAIVGGISARIDITGRRRAENEIREYSAELAARKRELEASNARLEALSITDGLTGLNNHRAFQECIDHDIRRAQQGGEPLSLLFLDVDVFKQYNDAFGHPAGDEVLKQVARILQESIRRADYAARLGGEEFAVVLPNTDAEDAELIAEHIRISIANQKWPLRGITVSIGIATFPTSTTVRSELITNADAALYAAKRSGRNCIRVYHPKQAAA